MPSVKAIARAGYLEWHCRLEQGPAVLRWPRDCQLAVPLLPKLPDQPTMAASGTGAS